MKAVQTGGMESIDKRITYILVELKNSSVDERKYNLRCSDAD